MIDICEHLEGISRKMIEEQGLEAGESRKERERKGEGGSGKEEKGRRRKKEMGGICHPKGWFTIRRNVWRRVTSSERLYSVLLRSVLLASALFTIYGMTCVASRPPNVFSASFCVHAYAHA